MVLMQPLDALRRSYETSEVAWTGTVNGKPACMFGVSIVSILTGTGAPWLLGTPEVEKNSIAFLRACRPTVEAMLAVSKDLENYVDARNKVTIAWLRWMGFKIQEAKPFGALGRPFHKFTMRG